MSSPQVVPVAAGFNIVTHVPFTIHHNLWQISFCSEHTVSTPSPNCKRHCLDESYSAPVYDRLIKICLNLTLIKQKYIIPAGSSG